MEKLIDLIKQEDADGWETLMFLYNANSARTVRLF